MADSFTSNFNFIKPADGDTNWGAAKLNPNLDSIDTQIKNRQDEISGHINKASGAHGIATNSLIVGTQEVQTLQNKTLNSPDITGVLTCSALTNFTNGLDVTGGNYAQIGGQMTLTSANLVVQSPGTITGNGSGITNLDATDLASGTVPDARLSDNVALLNRSVNAFSGATFAGSATFNNSVSFSSFTSLQSGIFASSTVATSNYTATLNDFFILASSSGINIRLCSVFDLPGKLIIVKNISNGDITVRSDTLNAGLIDNSFVQFTLGSYSSSRFICTQQSPPQYQRW